jgi:hypothetical protein
MPISHNVPMNSLAIGSPMEEQLHRGQFDPNCDPMTPKIMKVHSSRRREAFVQMFLISSLEIPSATTVQSVGVLH